MTRDYYDKGDARTGSTNWNSVGNDESFKNLKDGITTCLGDLTPDKVGAICLGMAGVDTPPDQAKLEGWVRQILPNPNLKVMIENDGIIGLVSGTKKKYGVVVIAGTGSIVVSVDAKGEVHRAGGWGPLLGDEGSGYQIGMSILKLVCRAHDRNNNSLLKRLTLEHLSLSSATELISWTYTQDKLNSAKFAALSQIAFKAAEEGDAEAISILEAQATEIAETVVIAHANSTYNEPDFPVVFCGGNLTHSGGTGLYAAILRKKILERFPTARILQPQVESHIAASLLALQML